MRSEIRGLCVLWLAAWMLAAVVHGAEPFNVLVPVDWSREPREEQVKALRRLYDEYDIRKFVLISPWAARYFGRGTLSAYEKSGEDLAWAKEAMESRPGAEIGWWIAPSIGSARDFPGQPVMDSDGHCNDGRCPLSDEFATAFCKAVAAGISKARPRVLFFEDDYTLGNQGALNRLRGCFCPLHCAAFAKRVGRTHSPSEIAAFFNAPTDANRPLRQAFAETIRDSLVSLARRVRETIDAVDPTIRVCVCQSLSADWDGDTAEALARAFAGGTRPMLRVYGSEYGNENHVEMLPQRLSHTIWTLEHVSSDVEMIHETDAYPHTRFYQSSLFLLSELSAAVAAGARGSFFYGTQYNDQPLSDTGYFDRLKEYRARLAVVRDLRATMRPSGVRAVFTPAENYLLRAKAPAYFKGMLPTLGNFLGKMGFPLTTSEDAPVAVLHGHTVDVLDDAEIRRLLSGGLLIDGLAARKLAQRGFSDLIGCKVDYAPYDRYYLYEKILPASGCSGAGKKLTNRHYDAAALPGSRPAKADYMQLEPAEGTEVLSALFDYDDKFVMPTVLFARNRIGGRIGVMYQRLSATLPASVYSDRKQELFHRLFDRLAEGRLDVVAPAAPSTWLVAAKNERELLVFAENLAGEPRSDIVLSFGEKWRGGVVSQLAADGSWNDIGTAGEAFRMPEKSLLPMVPAFFKVTLRKEGELASLPGICSPTSVVSVTWGKSCNYVPHSTEPLDWSGSLSVASGRLAYVDHLKYVYYRWTQQIEEPHRIYESAQGGEGDFPLSWTSFSKPGDPLTLEGLRFAVEGSGDAEVRLCFGSGDVRFRMQDLLDREHLRFHVGGKYSGVPVDVFLGPDARPRISRRAYEKSLDDRASAGALVMPDDFTTTAKSYYHSMYGALLPSNSAVSATFDIHNWERRPPGGQCRVRLQLTAVFDYRQFNPDEPVDFEVKIGRTVRKIPYVFTLRASLPKLEDVYLDVPWPELKERGNAVTISHLGGRQALLVHRVYVGAEEPSLRHRLDQLPPLPAQRHFHVGTETDLLTPANGDTDRFLDSMHEEQWGDFVKFRERSAKAPLEMCARWRDKVRRYGFVASLDGNNIKDPSEAQARRDVFASLPPENYIGVHGHEYSNLAYGWGKPDPHREGRTLPECRDSYLMRMKAFDVVGQCVPVQHLDYAAGVKMVMSEIPGSHASLMLAAARGASRAYGGAPWGCHFANHVTRAPLDQDHVRRLFVLSSMSWLDGARIVYDEEVALRYNHDTVYACSDGIPTQYRTIYQDLYHYGNAINLGRESVRTCFLQGNYDFVIGGVQAQPTTVRTKFWGKFGPETAGWDFDTPEDGWKLLDSYLPCVWLYPVLQDPRDIRLFFSGTPRGQVDLTPITAGLDVLSTYSLLVLPGWNTMTDELYGKLKAYVVNGGHLVLSAAQCTRHVTRDFLVAKKGFCLLNDGDLSALCGVRVAEDASVAPVRSVAFGGQTFDFAKDAPAFNVELSGAKPIATDQAGRPFLVENCMGKGRVWTLVAGEYWGHPSFAEFNRAMCERLAEMHLADVELSGDVAEVDWHVYDCEDFRRLVLLNTDWTSSGNVKDVCVRAGGISFPEKVAEGRMRHILVKGSAAVCFDVPSAIVDNLKADETGLSFNVQGCRSVVLAVHAGRPLATPTVVGAAGVMHGSRLHLHMGDTWSSASVRIDFAK